MEAAGSASTIRVSIYSDYTCPWCYVGSARLQRLKKELSGEVDLVDTWMPFEIHPEIPAKGMSVDELPYPKDRFQEMMAYLKAQAEEEGLSIADREELSNTHKALAAATFVQDKHRERFPEMHEGLFKAYFEEGRDLNDVSVLREIASAAGVAPDAVEEVLQRGDYDDAIAATGEMARRLGINGTPTFVFANEYAVVGAHPVSTMRSAVREVLEKKSTNG